MLSRSTFSSSHFCLFIKNKALFSDYNFCFVDFPISAYITLFFALYLLIHQLTWWKQSWTYSSKDVWWLLKFSLPPFRGIYLLCLFKSSQGGLVLHHSFVDWGATLSCCQQFFTCGYVHHTADTMLYVLIACWLWHFWQNSSRTLFVSN